MNFTDKDMLILLSSVIMIILMSMVFPVMGLMDEDTGISGTGDIPELDVSTDTIELVGDRPTFPRTTDSGELRYTTDRAYEWSASFDREPDDNDDGFEDKAVFVQTFCINNDPINEDCEVQLQEFYDGNLADDDEHIIQEQNFTGRTTLSTTNYTIRIDFISVENWNTTDLDYTLGWEITESPDDSTFSGIPFLGTLEYIISLIFSVLNWVFLMFFWLSAFLVESAINLIGILLNVGLYLISFISFIITTMTSIVSNTEGLVQAIISIPLILFSFELGKIILIIVNLLPFTG